MYTRAGDQPIAADDGIEIRQRAMADAGLYDRNLSVSNIDLQVPKQSANVRGYSQTVSGLT